MKRRRASPALLLRLLAPLALLHLAARARAAPPPPPPEQHVCPVVLPLPAPPSDAPLARVIDGRHFAFPDALYHASLASPPSARVRRCTASRLSKRWLLTAAHCRVTRNWSVSLRAPSIHGGIPALIARVLRHPNYTRDTDRRFDVAAIELRAPPSYEPPDVPVVLLNNASTLPMDHAFVRVSGYGKATRDDPAPHNYGALRFADIPVYPFDKCRAAYQRFASVGELQRSRQLCAGYESGGCDACAGDSGGPLVQYDARGRAVQVALVSAAHGCALQRYPGINARVDAVLPWLRSVGVRFQSGTPQQRFIAGGIHALKPSVTPTPTPTPLPPASFPRLTPAPAPTADALLGDDDDGALLATAVPARGERDDDDDDDDDDDERDEEQLPVASAAAAVTADDGERDEARGEAPAAREEARAERGDARMSDVTVGVVAGVGGGAVVLASLASAVRARYQR